VNRVLRPIHGVFNHPGIRKFLRRIRYALGVAAAAIIIPLARRDLFLPGAAVALFGAVWQWWCFACIMTSQELAVNGPYRFMRNPMYAARFFLILGLLIMTGNLWLIGGYVVLYCFYAVNRVRREEAKLRRLFGAPYETYCRSVPRFLPDGRLYGEGRTVFFSRRCFGRNHGWTNMAVVIVALAALAASVYIFRMG
jgi:hypothetical protein